MSTPLDCPLIFADTETTGLTRPYLRRGRRIWELALIRRDINGNELTMRRFVRVADLRLTRMLPWRVRIFGWRKPLRDKLQALPPDVLKGLNIGGFFERHPEMNPSGVGTVVSEAEAAALLMDGWLTPDPARPKARPHLVGAVPSFEDLGLADLLLRHGLADRDIPWHYHLIDGEVYAAGRLGALPPWDSKQLTRELGIDPDVYDQHTALGDALWIRDLFDAARADRQASWGEDG